MIVDCHTHVWEYPGHLTDEFVREASLMRATPVNMSVRLEEHLRDMEPVDRAVVLAADFGHSGMVVSNEYVAGYVGLHREKLIGFASVDPAREDALARLEHAVQDLGLRGLKLSPVYQNFHPIDGRAMALYEKAVDLGTPILFHQATTFVRAAPLKYAHPILLEDVALSFPGLRIVLAHMGHPWEADTIVLIRKQPNVYADISGLYYRPWQFYNTMLLAMEYNVVHKLLFGSDYPVTKPLESMEALQRVNDVVEGTGLPRVPMERMREVIERDAVSLLRIKP